MAVGFICHHIFFYAEAAKEFAKVAKYCISQIRLALRSCQTFFLALCTICALCGL